ncbi:MAG: mechanosensitive ion channel [marine benthic group bacterium]|nr:mechanosensitive ion channel [Gemmatimonadota bacterium]
MQAVDAESLINQFVDVIAQWGLRVVGALAVLLIGRMAAGWGRKLTRNALERAGVDATIVPFLAGLVYFLILAFVLLAVLGLFGIPTTSIIAVLGAASLAVGLALQGTLANFASGVMLLLFRPFQIGDFIEVGGVSGVVETIGVFSTVLNTPDNVRITIPNGQVYGEPIKNFTANPNRRIDLVAGVAYDDDLQVVHDTIVSVLEEDPRVLDEPAPQVAVSELGDSSVNLVVRPWCKAEDYWDLRFDLTRRMKERLEEAGCSIPFPQQDIHLIRWPQEGGDKVSIS